MPKKRDEKRRWTDPVILAPIIVAVITAIVGPTYAYYYLQTQNQGNPPAETPTKTPTPESPTPPAGQSNSLNVSTDKTSYVIGEDFLISGDVGKPEFGKSVRIDIYKPDGGPLGGANSLFAKPERDGSYRYFLYTFNLDLVPGTYTVRETYLKQSAETNFDLVQ